ncbi:MAG: ATP-dependent sacrificial sulfur transferase LarE [Eggerthellaceae bacterium]|jgi:uncharacterized protein
MTDTLQDKLETLQRILSDLGCVAVAYSGGVDSSLLLKVAHDTLGSQACALIADTASLPRRELKLACDFCMQEAITYRVVRTHELDRADFRKNGRDRCYICKREIFTKLLDAADDEGMHYLCEGSNEDDMQAFRPGNQAILDLGIQSPLKEAGLSKSDVRELARRLHIPQWDKAAFSCLATRIPYGEEITREALFKLEQVEDTLYDLGLRQFRARMQTQDLVRIEVLPCDFEILMQDNIRQTIIATCKNLGFIYITLDLEGFRSGSMDEVFGHREGKGCD